MVVVEVELLVVVVVFDVVVVFEVVVTTELGTLRRISGGRKYQSVRY